MILVVESGISSLFTKRATSQKANITEFLELLRVHHEELDKISQKTVELHEEKEG